VALATLALGVGLIGQMVQAFPGIVPVPQTSHARENPTPMGLREAPSPLALGCRTSRITIPQECTVPRQIEDHSRSEQSIGPAPWIGAVIAQLANVTVPENPGGVAVAGAMGEAFLAGSANGSTGTFTGLANGSIETTLGLAGPPGGIAYDPETNLTYVTEPTQDEVQVVSGGAVIANVTDGDNPDMAAFDPITGDVYVANETGSSVAVLSGSTVIENISTGYTGIAYYGNWFGAVVCDPASGLVYVTQFAQHQVAVLNGTRFVQNITFSNSDLPVDAAYSPRNGLVYVSFYSGGIAVINGTSAVGQFPTSAPATALAYDPINRLIYLDEDLANGSGELVGIVGLTALPDSIYLAQPCGPLAANQESGLVIVACSPDIVLTLSTNITVTSVSVLPVGNPANSFDDGQTVTAVATMAADGINWISAAVVTTPIGGLNCSLTSATLVTETVIDISAACTGVSPGSYVVSLDGMARSGYSTGANATITVFPPLQALAPFVGVPPAPPAASADVGQPVELTAMVSGGTGNLSSIMWTGLSNATCGSLDAQEVSCVFEEPGPYIISYMVTDSNGAATASPPISLPIYSLPAHAEVHLNRSSLDVGQSVTLDPVIEAGSGAPGGVTVRWAGEPSGCTPTLETELVCVPHLPGNYSITFVATDANLGSSDPSPAATLGVAEDPRVNLTSVGESEISAGHTFTLEANTSGGAGPYEFTWRGAPFGCFSSASTMSCAPSVSGTFEVSVSVKDSNNWTTSSSAVTLTVAEGPGAGNAGIVEEAAWVVGAGALGVIVIVIVVRTRLRPPPPEPVTYSSGEDSDGEAPTGPADSLDGDEREASKPLRLRPAGASPR
jgi:hypothetical protein